MAKNVKEVFDRLIQYILANTSFKLQQTKNML